MVFSKFFASHCWLVTDSPHSFPIFAFSYSRWPCYVRAPDLLFIFLSQIQVHNLCNKYWFSCLTSVVVPSMSSQQDRYHPPLLYRNVIILCVTLLQQFHYFPQLLLTPKCQSSQTTSSQGVWGKHSSTIVSFLYLFFLRPNEPCLCYFLLWSSLILKFVAKWLDKYLPFFCWYW